MSANANEAKVFRQVLGQYPTGVCIVTSIGSDGSPVGITVGSFTSVSLDPPLVGFLPGRNSVSWKTIESSGRFCVNILGADQEGICRQFASSGRNKFEGIRFRSSPAGSPILGQCVAWIDCELASVAGAGDHVIVLGKVLDLQIEAGGLPLLFFQGGYGRFLPLSMAAPDPLGNMASQLRHVDIARPEMERLSAELSARCMAIVRSGNELVVAASSGSSTRGSIPAAVGQRLPFTPPMGADFLAWSGDAEVAAWIDQAPADERPQLSALLKAIRRRGCSAFLPDESHRTFGEVLEKLARGTLDARDFDLKEVVRRLSYNPADPTPDVAQQIGMISAPVFGPRENVALVLSLFDFPATDGVGHLGSHIDKLMRAAAVVTAHLGGRVPAAL